MKHLIAPVLLLFFLPGLLLALQAVNIRSHGGLFLYSLVCLLVFLAGLGQAIKGRPAGLLIDSRNCISLSRLQWFCWMSLFVAAYWSAVCVNLSQGSGTPFAVWIPPELAALLGLSITTALAAPLILQTKDQGDTRSAMALIESNRINLQRLRIKADLYYPTGRLNRMSDPQGASWLQLFLGDEVNNAVTADPAKVQQFLVTVMLLLGYGAATVQLFASKLTVAALPAMDASFVSLLGLSHAAYLAGKAIPGLSGKPESAGDTTTRPDLALGAPDLSSAQTSFTAIDNSTRIINACKSSFKTDSNDCNHFFKAVCRTLGVSISGHERDRADDLTTWFGAGTDWIKIVDKNAAVQAAAAGWLVVCGLKAADTQPGADGPATEGHVAIVVAGGLSPQGYPFGFWGSTNNAGAKPADVHGFNESLTKGWKRVDLDSASFVYAKRRLS